MSTAIRQRLTRAGAVGAGTSKRAFPLSAVEIVFIVIAFGFVLAAIVYYVRALGPERQRLRALQQQSTLITTVVDTGPENAGSSVAKQVQDALDSLQQFRHDHLTNYGPGRIALIDELNALVKKHGLQLTSGIDMTARGFEEQESEDDKKSGKGSAKKSRTDPLANVYPNIAVRLTVFGQYKNLRAFVADTEKSKTFVIVDSMSLINQEQKASSRSSRGSGVSGLALTLDMSAYFRPSSAPQGE